tara:strand:+ start:5240 stop:6166 length:927 start_codon:yes stop_codon:yes gene_type:complete
MADIEKTEFRFPDENNEVEPGAVNASDEVEVEIVDDTPDVDKGRKPMKEAPAEVTDDELEQYSEGVKKRIQHFSKGYHEERRAKESALREREEAIKLAQSVIAENKKLQGSLGEGQAALLEQAKRVVNNEIDEAKRQLKEAHDAFDTDAIVAAQEALTTAKIRSERVNNFKPPVQQQENEVQPAYQPVQAHAEVRVDNKAKAWQEANSWFGNDEEMTAVALTVHKKLVDNGVDPTSDEYYEKINSRVHQLFPDAFPQAKQKKSQVVASATRSTAPRKIVLTQTQVSIAKRLGVPLELYAKQVAEQMRK